MIMDHGAVQRKGPGRPRLRPHRVAAEKGSSVPQIRRWCQRHGVRVTIPRRDERRRGPFDRQAYRQHACVEQFTNRLKQSIVERE